jgi:hypothetical protein
MRKTETADLSSLSPTEQKRQIVIQELINTEENYMEDMSIVNEVMHFHSKSQFVLLIHSLVLLGVPKTDGRIGCRQVGRR